MAFRESDGEFLWQQAHRKLESGRANDWPFQGIASSPLVEDGRLYYVSNRGVVLCLDVEGFRDNENDGPFTDEELTSQFDADVIWAFDMMEEVGAYPHNLSNSSPVLWDDLIYVSTSNGQDESHVNIPSPRAPAIIAINKVTGELVWEDNSVEDRILHGQWSTPDGRHDRRSAPGGLGAGRRLGAGVRGRERQQAVGVRQQPGGFGLAADPERAHRHARDFRRPRLHRQRPGPRARRGRRAPVRHRRDLARRHHADRRRLALRSRSAARFRRSPSPTGSSTSPTSAVTSIVSTRRPASCTGRTTSSQPCGPRPW